MHENETCWLTIAGLGLALADALRGGGALILLVFWNETEVAPNTVVISMKKRKGKRNRVDWRIMLAYVTVTVNVGPVAVGGMKLPAHTPIVMG